MSSQRSKVKKRALLIAALATMALGVGAASASAAEVSATPNTKLSKSKATNVAVSGTGFKAGEKYRVGLCSAEVYGILGIPACGEMVEVTANGSGQISTTVTVEKTTFNVHSEIPFPLNVGQPEEFTCAGNTAINDECEIVAAAHGGTKEVLARKAVTFE